jgi:outer membrane immunogenic protein
MKKLIVAAAILAASAAGASAADLGAVPYRPAPMITPAYDWSGFYWGGNGGWGSSRNCWDQVAPAAPFAFIGAEGCHNATGGTAGGQLGFRVQSYASR